MGQLTQLNGHSILLLMTVMLAIVIVICNALFSFFNSAAPTSLMIASGPPSAIFQKNAEKYKIFWPRMAFGDLLYGLRSHINFVRNPLMAEQSAKAQ